MNSRTSCIFIALLLAVIIRVPFIGTALPYFHDEDEAHHFDRNLRMVQSGDFDPHYFHKPSLHFYLRIPAIALGFFNEVREERIKSIKDAITSDPFGVGGYAFSSSHPGLVKWARTVSILLSVLSVFLVFLITEYLFGLTAAAMASLLAAINPALVEYSGVVGVDTLMGFFALLTTWAAVVATSEKSKKHLILSAVAAGLAISSKYNAAPAILLPPIIAAFTFCEERTLSSLGLFVIIGASFLAGTPYLLSNLPLFLDHAGYEVWHYAVAGHEGHTAEPGLGQLLFFLSWLGHDAIGWSGLILGAIGTLWVLFMHRAKAHLVLASFPLAYLFFMCAQKTNFTRNLVPFIPYLIIAAAYALTRVPHLFSFAKRNTAAGILAALTIIQPVTGGLDAALTAYRATDTRIAASKWITDHRESLGRIALDGSLQFDWWTKNQTNLEVVDFTKITPKELAQKGITTVIVPQWSTAPEFNQIYRIDGDSTKTRVLNSPAIIIASLNIPSAPANKKK